MNDLKICRRITIPLGFSKPKERARIYDHCEWSLSLGGRVDADSGMIINLVEIDQALDRFKKNFNNHPIENIFLFFQTARDFLQKSFISSPVQVEMLSLNTSYGTVQWQFPWREYDFLFVQKKKVKVLDETQKGFKIQNFLIEKRGSSVEFFTRPSSANFKNFWRQRNLPQGLFAEMKKIKNVSGFGFQEFQKDYWQYRRLTFQEFSAKAFGK